MKPYNWTSAEKAWLEKIDPSRLPKHVAIIMDGNGRWAKQKRLPRIEGHRVGVQVTCDIVRCCRRLNIPFLTLYAFSEENWSRPTLEIKALMKLLEIYLIKERREFMENDIRLATIGNKSKLPPKALATLEKTMRVTENNKSMLLNIALSYSGRDEIIRAVKKIIDAGVKSDDVDMPLLSRELDTAQCPDPDLLIRTSGELRISNFMLWQLAYTELYITETLWPDFNNLSLFEAVVAFQNRKRRFGGVDDNRGPMVVEGAS